ncbi:MULTISPECIES: hypothetical protein [Kamptonema]|nr:MULTISPECIES: hypothetical protein [Kamptonema]
MGETSEVAIAWWSSQTLSIIKSFLQDAIASQHSLNPSHCERSKAIPRH